MHYYSSWQCAKLLRQRTQIKNWSVFYICQCVVITGTRSSTNFHSRKCIWIYRLHDVGHFDQVSTRVTRWRGMFIHRPLAHGRCGSNFESTAFKFIESAKTTSMQKNNAGLSLSWSVAALWAVIATDAAIDDHVGIMYRCNVVSIVINGGTVGCHSNRCCHWRLSWHHYNSHVPVPGCLYRDQWRHCRL